MERIIFPKLGITFDDQGRATGEDSKSNLQKGCISFTRASINDMDLPLFFHRNKNLAFEDLKLKILNKISFFIGP